MRHLIVAVVLVLVLVVPGFANQILAIGENNHLYSIVPTTGVISDLGTLPTPAAGGYGDLAWDPFNNTLYAVSFDAFATLHSFLYSIPVNNPAGATVIGDTGVIGMNALEMGTNGVLLGVGTTGLNQFFQINITTGAATAIGSPGTYTSEGDLEFHSGVLYLSSSTPSADTLFTVDPNTGIGTAKASPIGFSTVFGLAFDDDAGVMYGFTDPGSGTGNVISINLTTGVGTLVHSYPTLFIGATDVESVAPEPGTVVLFACGLGLLSIGYLRRRRTAKS